MVSKTTFMEALSLPKMQIVKEFANKPNVSDFLFGDTSLPVPDWDRAEEWIKLHASEAEQYEVWTEFALQWMQLTNQRFDNRYEILQTKHFLLFGSPETNRLRFVGNFVEECRSGLLNNLPGLAKFSSPGKTPIFIFWGYDAYYAHIGDYYADGEYGGSSGIHMRNCYDHIAIAQVPRTEIYPALAHELTHAVLSHVQMPIWLEEGLTQVFEHDLGNKPFVLSPEEVGEQKAFWRQAGLDQFWSGTGFSSPGDVQKYSYQLAEILMRLLLLDYQPRWFGFDKSPTRTLMTFLQTARCDDHGEAAAREVLGLSLADIAAKSLGQRGGMADC